MNTRNKFMGALMSVLFLISLLTLAAPPRASAALNGWAPLDAQAQALTGFNYVGIFDATNFITAVTNANSGAGNTLFPKVGAGTVNFPAGTRVKNVAVKLTTAVATSSGATSIALSIGDTVATNRWIAGFAVGTNATLNSWAVNHGTNFVYNTATNLTLHFTPVAGAVPEINAGRFEVYLNALNLNDANGN